MANRETWGRDKRDEDGTVKEKKESMDKMEVTRVRAERTSLSN